MLALLGVDSLTYLYISQVDMPNKTPSQSKRKNVAAISVYFQVFKQ